MHTYDALTCVCVRGCGSCWLWVANTEADNDEEGRQEELERLYSTLYQLDAQVRLVQEENTFYSKRTHSIVSASCRKPA